MAATSPVSLESSATSMLTPPRDSTPWKRIIALTLAILAIYSYPSLRTYSATKSTTLPAVTAEDLGLYLSLRRIERDPGGTPLEPYYGLHAPSNSAGFFKFRLGPMAFGWLTDLLRGRMWAALFLWNLVWWGILCVSAAWLFSTFLPRGPTEFILVGIALLMLLNLGMLKALAAAWTHLPSLSLFERVEIVYIRPFIPQIAIPILLVYVGLQMDLLRNPRSRLWVAMTLTQFLAFAAFPYAMLLMAGTTAVVAIQQIIANNNRFRLRSWALYAVGCATLDVAFLLHGHGGFRTGTPGQSSFFHLQLSLLPLMIGRLWIVMAILLVGTALNKRLGPEVKWPLVGLCLTTMLLVLGDAVVPERVLFLSDHAGYFVHPTIIVLLTFLASSYFPESHQLRHFLRVTSIFIVTFCLANGLLTAEGNYRRHLSTNFEQADVAKWLARGEVQANDLVISRDEDCAWVPLLSRARVLFCRIAQCLLTSEQNQQTQRLREVLYLYFNGKDGHWLETTTQFERYGFYYETSAKGENRNEEVVKSRSEMRPYFRMIENDAPSIREFFRNYSHVWIAQKAEEPLFDQVHLQCYFDLGRQERVGDLVITLATPK